MENNVIRIPISGEGYGDGCLKIDEKALNNAGFRRGELMSVSIKDGRIEIERGKELPGIDQMADSCIKQMSYYDGGYKGYEVSLKLQRHNTDEYEPRYISSAREAYDFLRPMQYEPREKILSMMLDVRNKLIGVYTSSTGTIDYAFLTPFEVIQPALLANSRRIILAHNHPSGDSAPSPEDRSITDKIKEAAKMMNMQILDHIVIGDGNYTSFLDKGYL